jgi:hypothetical protein
MANIVINIGKGRVVEYYNRVKSNDPANSALILVPIQTTGLEADSVLVDKADLAAFLSGATDEQTTMGRKTLDDTALAALPAPDTPTTATTCRCRTSPGRRRGQRDQQDPRLLRQRHDRRHGLEHRPALPARLRSHPQRYATSRSRAACSSALDPAVTADEATVTLSTTNKALIPAARYNQLGTQFFNKVGRKLRIRAFGKITTAATPGNLTMALLFGTGADANGTSLGATAAVALIASQTNISWELEVYIHCRSVGSTGSLFGTGKLFVGNALVATSIQPILLPASAAAASASVDLTGTLIPSLQFLRSGSTAETITVQDYEIDPLS